MKKGGAWRQRFPEQGVTGGGVQKQAGQGVDEAGVSSPVRKIQGMRTYAGESLNWCMKGTFTSLQNPWARFKFLSAQGWRLKRRACVCRAPGTTWPGRKGTHR